MAMKVRSAVLATAAMFAGAGLLAACDKSPQNADGATAQGDPGTAASTQNGTLADTGQDNGNAQIGAAGEVGTPQSIGGATSPDGMAPSAGEATEGAPPK
jgi:hypothetical protein